MAGALAALDPVLARALGAAVALVLLLGAGQKLREWEMFRAALADYRLLPGSLVTPVAIALPVLELVAGVALLAGPVRAAGAALAVALLAGVTAAVAVNLLRGRVAIDCGCGGIEAGQQLSWGLVARNLVLMVAAVLGAQEGVARELHWLDYATVAGASLALYGLYAAASQLLANGPRLAALRQAT